MNLRTWLKMAVAWGLAAAVVNIYIQHAFGPFPDPVADFLRALSEWALYVPLNAAALRLFARMRERQVRGVRWLACHVLASVVFGSVHAVGVGLMRGGPIPTDKILWGIAFYFVMTSVITIVRNRRALAQSRATSARLERHLTEARLAALEAQVSPHFLFNTLHAIGVTCRSDPERAAQMITLLGDLLRDSLGRGRDVADNVAEEVRRVTVYLDLMALRYGGDLKTSVEVDEGVGACHVPPFAVQALVENAVKHGIEARTSAQRIAVSVVRRDGCVAITVGDDGPGFPDEWEQGVGLRSLEERLNAYSDGRARFEIGQSPWGGAQVSLFIPVESLA